MTINARNLDAPDERHPFERGHLDVVNLTGATIARATFHPGWRWSTHVKPLVGTDSCQSSHAGYVISGRFCVRMDDGEVHELGPGDAHVVPAGHDGWVVGDETYVAVDFAATGSTACRHVSRCPCGVEFRVASDHQLGQLVSAIQQHARSAHSHEVTRQHILAELAAT